MFGGMFRKPKARESSPPDEVTLSDFLIITSSKVDMHTIQCDADSVLCYCV